MTTEPETPVLFRMDRHGKHREVTAVFPTQPADISGAAMSCYAHIGQHGACCREWLQSTRPAKPDEYADLKAELEAVPYEYRLKVYRRITPQLHDVFRAALRRDH